MAEPDGDILTLDEVAAYLKAGKRTVYRLAANGEIPAFKLGGTWRFRKSDLERWIASRTGETAFGTERGGKAAPRAAAAASTPGRATKRTSKG
jgi:excisionase family DNA binding protein